MAFLLIHGRLMVYPYIESSMPLYSEFSMSLIKCLEKPDTLIFSSLLPPLRLR